MTTAVNIGGSEITTSETPVSYCTDYLKKMAVILSRNSVAQDVASSLLSEPLLLTDRRAYFNVDAYTARDMDETISYLNHPEKLGIKSRRSFLSARYYAECKVEVCCGYAFPQLNWSERFGDIPEGRITRFKVAFIWFNRSKRRLTKEQLEREWNELYATSLGAWSLQD